MTPQGVAPHICAVCLEPVALGSGVSESGTTPPYTRLPRCGHLFHRQCLPALELPEQDALRCFVCQEKIAWEELHVFADEGGAEDLGGGCDAEVAEAAQLLRAGAADAAVARSAAGESGGSNPHGKLLPRKSWRAVRRDPRLRLLREIFRELDMDGDGKLDEMELFAYAVEAGFDCNIQVWRAQYEMICEACGASAFGDSGGLHEAGLVALLNGDSNIGAECPDDDLQGILSRLRATRTWRTQPPKTKAVPNEQGVAAGHTAPAPAQSAAEWMEAGTAAGVAPLSTVPAAAPAMAREVCAVTPAAASTVGPIPLTMVAPAAALGAAPPAAVVAGCLWAEPDTAAAEAGVNSLEAAPTALSTLSWLAGDGDDGLGAAVLNGCAGTSADRTERAGFCGVDGAGGAVEASVAEVHVVALATLLTHPESSVVYTARPEVDERDWENALVTQLLPWIRTRSDNEKAEACTRKLESLVHTLLPEGQRWSLHAYGSIVSGFGSRGSDLDLTMIEASGVVPSDARDVLRQLGSVLADDGTFVVEALILNARVPIVCLRYQGLEVDVSVNNVAPLRNTELLKAYADLHPSLPQLGLAVKLWAESLQILGAQRGFLSSYALVLMVIYFLQAAATPPLPCLQRGPGSWATSLSLQQLLRAFFRFYAEDFQWGSEVVSVRLGRRSTAGTFSMLRGRFLDRLHIEDPYELWRNLGDVLWEQNEQFFRDALRHEAFSSALWSRELSARPPGEGGSLPPSLRLPSPPPHHRRSL